MSVSFTAVDANNPRTLTINGNEHTFPSRVDLGEEWELFNLCNANARALLGFLGLPFDDGCGDVTIPEARRAIMRARASFDSRAPRFTRPDEVGPNETRVSHEGNVAHVSRGPRVFGMGIDEGYLRERMEQFADFVEAAAKAGATGVTWG